MSSVVLIFELETNAVLGFLVDIGEMGESDAPILARAEVLPGNDELAASFEDIACQLKNVPVERTAVVDEEHEPRAHQVLEVGGFPRGVLEGGLGGLGRWFILHFPDGEHTHVLDVLLHPLVLDGLSFEFREMTFHRLAPKYIILFSWEMFTSPEKKEEVVLVNTQEWSSTTTTTVTTSNHKDDELKQKRESYAVQMRNS